MFRRWRKLLTRTSNAFYLILVPVGRRWENAQRRYLSWAETPMSTAYLNYVKILGEEFSVFVGVPTRMIDVGCGNGVFNGMSYDEAGYLPLKRRGRYILGVDPLPIVKPIPWLSEFRQGKIEEMKLSDFNEATFVTTFDHIQDPNKALQRLLDAGVTKIYLWETLYRVHNDGDRDHPHHYTYSELIEMLRMFGFSVVRSCKVDENKDTEGYFIEAKRI